MPALILNLVARLAEGLDPEVARILQMQIASAVVTEDTATMLDVDVAPTVELLPVDNGPLSVIGVVTDDAGEEVGEVLLWVKAGRFIGLEQSWFTDEPPTSWPSLDRLTLD